MSDNEDTMSETGTETPIKDNLQVGTECDQETKYSNGDRTVDKGFQYSKAGRLLEQPKSLLETG